MNNESTDPIAGATLRDFGEFRLINELIKPALANVSAPGIGDDCSHIPVEGPTEIVISTDATPTPLTWFLGERSYDTWGWYSGLINASDLAAAGAHALGLSNSLEAPGTMLVSDLKDFFSGFAEFCRAFSILSAGGNIREGRKFACHSTAIGVLPKGSVRGRSGCEPGDVIVCVGACGEFISAFLKAQQSGISHLPRETRSILLRPKPQLEEMLALNRLGLFSAASDNSDGLIGSLWNIAEASRCAIDFHMREEIIPRDVNEAANISDLNPWNLMVCWGDWAVIASVPAREYDRFVEEATSRRIRYLEIGRARQGDTAIYGIYENRRRLLRVLRNEAFRMRSFANRPKGHIRDMLLTPLFADEPPSERDFGP